MKCTMTAFALLLSVSVFALTEVECSGRANGADVRLTIDGRWGQNYFKEGRLWIRKDGAVTTTRHSLSYRGPWGGLNRAEYSDSSMELEIDFWPDQIPRWGKTYNGSMRLDSFNSRFGMRCRFPFTIQ
jgi:hypothetical protein